jgi:hypothetical protein
MLEANEFIPIIAAPVKPIGIFDARRRVAGPCRNRAQKPLMSSHSVSVGQTSKSVTRCVHCA